MSKHAARFLYPLAGTLIIILAWHYYVVLFHVPVVVLPTPMQVLQAMVKEWKVLIEEGWITALECIYGFALAMALVVIVSWASARSTPPQRRKCQECSRWCATAAS